MPKRKRNKCLDSEYVDLCKKIKRLEKRIKRSRRHSDTSSADSEYLSTHNPPGE